MPTTMAATDDNAAASSSTIGPVDNHFTQILQKLLRTPLPGSIFVQATSPSDQINALQQIRSLTTVGTQGYTTAECHPNLLGTRVIDLQRDLRGLFQATEQEPSFVGDQAAASTSPASTKTVLDSSSISIFPVASQAGPAARLIVIPFAHLLRSTHPPLIWSQFLYPPQGYTVILVSSLSLDRWRTADGVEEVSGSRPIVRLTFRGVDLAIPGASDNDNKNAVQASLLETIRSLHTRVPSPAQERFKPIFIEYVYSSLASEVGTQEVEELQFLTGAIWDALGQLLLREAGGDQQAVDAKYKDRHALLSRLSPLVRGALRDLFPRKVGLTQWIDGIVDRCCSSHPSGGVSNPKSASAESLSPLTSLLLLSAFLASHLPPRTDTRYFLRDSSLLSTIARSSKKVRRSRKRGKGSSGGGLDDELDSSSKNTNSDPLLLGPKPFGMQRLLYIFENLCIELDVSLPSFQGEMLTTRRRSKRRRQAEDEWEEDLGEEGERRRRSGMRGRRLFQNDSPDEPDDQGRSKLDIGSLPVQNALLSLVQANYLLMVAPPTSGSIGSSATTVDRALDVGPMSERRIYLPQIPSRFEAIPQITMRCNVLKEELRSLLLGHAGGDSHGDDRREGERSRGGGGGGESYRNGDSIPATFGDRRKEWWTRLEECGL